MKLASACGAASVMVGCSMQQIKPTYVANFGGEPGAALATNRTGTPLSALTAGSLVVVPTKNTESFAKTVMACKERSD